MNKISTLSAEDIEHVCGGQMLPGESLYEYLMRRFPDGEWVGNSFFPNGAPRPSMPEIVTW